MAMPSWYPRVFSDRAQKAMNNKASAQITKLASEGSLLALHVLVSTRPRQRADLLPTYCSFLQHSERPDPHLLDAQDGEAHDAVDRACYCIMGVRQVLDAMAQLPRARDTLRTLTPLTAAWTGLYQWMVYIYALHRADATLPPITNICINTILCALTRDEMKDQVTHTPGIVAFTASVWMHGELTPDLPSAAPVWCLATILNSLPPPAEREVRTAAAPRDVAARLTRHLRIAAKMLPAATDHAAAYLQLLCGMGRADPEMRAALCAEGIMRTLTKALVRVSTRDLCRGRAAITQAELVKLPHVGLSLVTRFIEAGSGVDAVRDCVRAGILTACLNFGADLHALPTRVQTTALIQTLLSDILLRYVLFRSVTEAVCQSMRALQSTHPEAHFADAQLQQRWEFLGVLARSLECGIEQLESQASRSRATCANCLVNGRKASFKRCSRCHSFSYCSIQCQKAAWDEKHKAECSEYSRHYPAPILRNSDASFQKARVAFDARTYLPELRNYAAHRFSNIPLCSLAVYLDYTKALEPECALGNLFVNNGERRAHPMEHEGSDYRASTTIRYKIQLGEYEEIWTLKVASLWSEDEVGGDIPEQGDSELDIRNALDDVAERVSHIVVRTHTGSLSS
ncbi:hypothetical protein FA95DRAFT_1679864 [Auriscalpium vulgare]|uniref:Uncharacterized protein n=1 Tax=Auriscalpium vulgare TaxID=40419 RepID=A0ACB8RQ45_9AGAM|nr:hypothetical protein FA95DRAFT_1679864 [Auriscalpium vulgare]